MNNRFIQLVIILSLFLFGCGGISQELQTTFPTSDLWQGAWESDEFSSVYGNISTMLPKELQEGHEVSVPVVISFAQLSMYQSGTTCVSAFKGKMDNNIINGNYNPNDRIEPKILNLSFSNGKCSMAEEINIAFNKDLTKAIGYWKSPDGDKGSFTLTKSGV